MNVVVTSPVSKMLKKFFKIAAILFAIVFVGIQFFRIDQTNPPIVEGETLEAAVSVPSDVSQILSRSCNDCHSHKTVYPWYANIQPSGWFLKDHIDQGKSHLNFSKFNTLDTKKKVRQLEEICDEVSGGKMPLPSYLWIHHEAAITESQKKVLCDWANSEARKLEGVS